LSIDDELVLGEISEEAFEVVAALLNEDKVGVSKVLLGRNGRNWDAWVAGHECRMQQEELVVASLSFKEAFFVPTSHGVQDRARVVYWVAHRKLQAQRV
jgi:hypothetical protein